MKLVNVNKLRSIKFILNLYNLIFKPLKSEKGDYDYLRWNGFIDLLWRIGGDGTRAFLTKKFLTSSPHYLYPQNKLYFAPGEYESLLEQLRTSRAAIANDVLAKIIKADDEVLEFGCGHGLIIGGVAKYCRRGVGVDVSQAILRVAEYLNRDVPNVSYVKISGLDIRPIADQSLTFIYSIECIQHIEKVHAVKFFYEFYRLLKPNGKVLVQFPDLTKPEELDAWMNGTWKVQSERAYSDLTMMRIRYYTPEEIKILLERIGFRDVVFLDYNLQPVERAATYFLATR
ncbi:MAG: class I SAM-dependent methyltransferase [Pseudanabaenaceae cyanobacterium bins.39]|nr:class I SAM-dependent methyltransferase [Pseudanabaenaceae cyanobacterium bins.39]